MVVVTVTVTGVDPTVTTYSEYRPFGMPGLPETVTVDGVALLNEADLVGTFDLTQEQVDSASGDMHTKLPANLKRPNGWSK